MSTPLGGVRLPYRDARIIAGRLCHELVPVADHVMIVGSLRRKKQAVGDLELLVAPKMGADLFGIPLPEIAPIAKIVRGWGEWVKGGDRYMQVRLDGEHGRAGQGIKVDVFLCLPPQCRRCKAYGRIRDVQEMAPGGDEAVRELREGIREPWPAGMQPGVSFPSYVGEASQRPESSDQNVRRMRTSGTEHQLHAEDDVFEALRDGAAQQDIARPCGEEAAGMGRGSHQRTVSTTSSSVSSARGREGVRRRAQAGNGEEAGTAPRTVGARASSERHEDRQSSGESGDRHACTPERMGEVPILRGAIPGPLRAVKYRDCTCGANDWIGGHWGSLLAIRTGPAELGHLAMRNLLTRGMRHVDGCIWKGDVIVPTPTEDAFFEAAGLPCVPPEARDALVARLTVQSMHGAASHTTATSHPAPTTG